jgi:hypothetical protein
MQRALRLLILLACAAFIASLLMAPPAFLVSSVTVPAGLLLLLLLLLFGALRPRARAAPVKPAKAEAVGRSADVLDAIHASLVSYRSGLQVRARCPTCRSILLVSPAHAGRVSVSCACCVCDGAYEVLAPRQA